MLQLWKKNWLVVLLVAALSTTSAVAAAQEADEEEQAEQDEAAEEEEAEEEEAEEEAAEEEEAEEEATPPPRERASGPTFGFGVETGLFFTDLERFNAYVLEPNDQPGFDLWGTQFVDLFIESRVLDNVRLSLFGGLNFAWHSNPSLFAWYVGLEPAYVAGDDTWEMAIGLSAGVGALSVSTDQDRLDTSLAMLRPFLEVRRYFSDHAAAYVRAGFNQWYPRNPRAEDWTLLGPDGNTLDSTDLGTGGLFVSLGARFGQLRGEELEPEPECSEETVVEDCPDVPEPSCEDGVLRTYAPVCEEGECSYEATAVDCGAGMMCGEVDGEAVCVEEPECSEDGDCDEVPDSFCEDRVLTTFGGVCVDGECQYEPEQTPCEEGYQCGMEDGEPACVEEPEEELVEVDVETRRVEIADNIYFALDSDEIESESYPLLNQMARVLNENPQVLRVRIEGHTDDQGTAAYNRELSQRRAESVMRALVERGVDAERLEARGFGQERPITSNATEEGRARNRRVELHIVEIEGEQVEEADEADEAEEVEGGGEE